MSETDEFVEQSDQVLDPSEYSRAAKYPALVIIFNFNTFKLNRCSERLGSIRDINEFIICLQRLQINVSEDNIFEDFTTEEVKNKIVEITTNKENLQSYNSLIVLFGSHGGKNNEIETFDGSIKTDDIIFPMSRAKGLEGKPKLFIFQTCKGKEYGCVIDQHNQKVVPVVPMDIYKSELPGDIIIAFSSSEGTKSYRNTIYGSWFIQEICRNFSTYGRRDDVANLLIRVSKCVSYHCEYEYKNSRQMPLLVSTLTKKFYLTRCKSRNLMLLAIKKNEKCLEDLKRMIKIANS